MVSACMACAFSKARISMAGGISGFFRWFVCPGPVFGLNWHRLANPFHLDRCLIQAGTNRRPWLARASSFWPGVLPFRLAFIGLFFTRGGFCRRTIGRPGSGPCNSFQLFFLASGIFGILRLFDNRRRLPHPFAGHAYPGTDIWLGRAALRFGSLGHMPFAVIGFGLCRNRFGLRNITVIFPGLFPNCRNRFRCRLFHFRHRLFHWFRHCLPCRLRNVVCPGFRGNFGSDIFNSRCLFPRRSGFRCGILNFIFRCRLRCRNFPSGYFPLVSRALRLGFACGAPIPAFRFRRIHAFGLNVFGLSGPGFDNSFRPGRLFFNRGFFLGPSFRHGFRLHNNCCDRGLRRAFGCHGINGARRHVLRWSFFLSGFRGKDLFKLLFCKDWLFGCRRFVGFLPDCIGQDGPVRDLIHAGPGRFQPIREAFARLFR